MNSHFAFPPPGVVFLPHGQNYSPGYYVPPQHSQFAQYGAPFPPSSHNGAYPGYPYPPPPMNPNAVPFNPQYYYPLPPPGLPNNQSHHVYIPQATAPIVNHTHSHFPEHPPGLPIPHRIISSSTEREDSPVRDDPGIHDHWKGRLAPLPGYRSHPTLLPKKEVKAPEESKQEEKESKEPKRELLPPVSNFFYGSAYQKQEKMSKNNEKKEKTKKEFQMDKYADNFVPEYLKKIQREQHTLNPLPALPIFPSESYLNSFLSSSRIDSFRKSSHLHALLSSPPILVSATATPLELETYHQHWSDILLWELEAGTSDKEQLVLWKKSVKVAVWNDAEFVLDVQGIRENNPYLEIGDMVHMREIIGPEQKGVHRAVEGRIVALRKREGLVHISSQPLKQHIQTFVPVTSNTKTENGLYIFGPEDNIPLRFNLTFMMNSRPLCLMDSAVSIVAKMMANEDTKGFNLARQWIFPEPQEFFKNPSQKRENVEIRESQWVDSGLNVEQRLAVTAVALYESPIPHLISGPPGTGKTRTVVEAVLQIFRVQPEACILVCAPSHPATDTLVLRLKDRLLQHEMLRLNNPHRTFAEVPDAIKPFCYIENNHFSIPPWKKLMEYRVVVCSCLDASILVGAHCTNMSLMAMEEDLLSTVHPHRKTKHVVQPHWTHLLIDEAAQGSEPEILIPISVVLPQLSEEQTFGKIFMPQLTLCGDINQLGPLILSNEARAAEFEKSLLERLFERPLYANFSQLRKQFSGLSNGISQQVPPYTHLVKNYRSHPTILMPPSAIFYKDTLQPCAENGVISWTRLPNPKMPLKFIGGAWLDDTYDHDRRVSWFNKGEVETAVAVVKSLLAEARASNPPLRPQEIGIMAPWREQVRLLREELRKANFHAVDVGTVEDYQGRETRVVIISCVRSSARFLAEDHKKGIGLVLERKRMNVAITRAKELLVVIGNGELLSQHDPYWKGFLGFALRHKLYEGPELSDLEKEKDGNYISRLESDLILSRKGGLDLEAEDQGILVAGVVAREVLRD